MKLVSIAALVIASGCVIMAAPDKKYEVYDVNDAPALFEKFVKDYERQYKDEADRQVHYEAFVASLGKINQLNASGGSAQYGINKFADQTEEERKKMRGVLG